MITEDREKIVVNSRGNIVNLTSINYENSEYINAMYQQRIKKINRRKCLII